MAKKKVAILNPYVGTMGGGEKHMGYLCQFMEEYYNQDVEIDILVHTNRVFDIYSENFTTIQKINEQFELSLKHTKLLKFDLLDENSFWDTLKNKRTIEKMSKNYDVFIDFMFLDRQFSKAKKSIYEVMFPAMQYHWELHENIFRKIFGKLLDIKFYNSYDVFISNSQFTNHWQEEYWGKSKNNRVVYPPVFSEKEISGRYDESKKKNIIISVGRFFVSAHSKKQLEMVQFFVKHNDIFKDYEYHLCGMVSQEKKDQDYLSQVKAEASKVNNVFLHIGASHDELMELYSQAKIFWHGTGYMVDEDKEPEKMEHFGITTVEAMSYGAVPVVINKGGQKETVKEGVNGFHWETEEECVEGTRKLIEDDSLRKKMAEKSVEMAKDYSIEKFFEANRRIFDEYNI